LIDNNKIKIEINTIKQIHDNDMANSKVIVTKIDGKWVHDSSAFHSMTPDVSTYTVILGDPKSKFHTTISVALPSDVMLKQTANSLVYKGKFNAGTSASPAYTPDASVGFIYTIGSKGYINTTKVENGDMMLCTVDTSAATSATAETIDGNWNYIQRNLNEDDYSLHGHKHTVNLNGYTEYGGDVTPTGTVSAPAIDPHL